MAGFTAKAVDLAGHVASLSFDIPQNQARSVLLGSRIGQGHEFDLAAHTYLAWGEPITDSAPFLNIKMHKRTQDINGPGMWNAIAAGSEDTQLKAYAAALRAGPPKLVTFGHEPRQTQGTGAEYQAAWARVVSVLRTEGIGGCKIGTVLLASVYRSGQQNTWLPQNIILDYYGVDGYGDSGRLTAQATFDAYIKSHSVDAKAIFETSMRNGTTTQQQTYVRSVDALLKSDPTFLGCAFWEGVNGSIDTRLSGDGLAALQAMSVDPFYTRTLGGSTDDGWEGPMVNVNPGNFNQALLDANPSGTIFDFADGTYHGTYVPKANHKFRGGRNAIFDGQNAYSTPFTTNPFWAKGMTFKNYTEAGLKLTTGGKADGVRCTTNGYSGIKFDGATGVQIINGCELDTNGHYGFSGPDSVNCIVSGNDVHDNNTSHDPDGGGTKMVRTSGLQILGNDVSENFGAGIWLDIDNSGFVVDGNTCEGNDLWGIQVEISFGGTVSNNTVMTNGARGIYISTSGGMGLGVFGNTVSYNAESQITLGNEPRGGTYKTQNVHVHDNIVSGCDLLIEMFQYPEAPMGSGNTFVHNTYHSKTGGVQWRSLVGDKTFPGWQGLGNDTTGSNTSDATC